MRLVGPRVLAFSLGGPLAELRVRAPLQALFSLGEISAYSVVYGNGVASGPHQFSHCDCVLVQRDCYSWLSDRLRAQDLPFVLDLDDLLVVEPSYTEFRAAGHVASLVHQAAHVTCATSELQRLLSKYLDVDLVGRTSVVPNGLAFPAGAAYENLTPAALAWTSADVSSLKASAESVVTAIATFSRERSLPLFLFGTLQQSYLEMLPDVRTFGLLDFWAHKALLASQPLLGVAPLETSADPITLDFINSKSDLKMVEFGGFGHSAVYSSALPYAQSTLRTGAMTQNDYDGWYAALNDAYERCTERDFVNAAAIRSERNMDVIAKRHWASALAEVRLQNPIAVDKLIPTSAELRAYHSATRGGKARRLVSSLKQRLGL